MRAILVAGGSAGHINPALAIADKIAQVFPDSEILFIGTGRGLESKLVKRAGYAFTSIKSAGFQRKLTPKNIGRNAKAVYYFLTANLEAQKIIDKFKPDVVIGTGGYVTAPVLRTASKAGIKAVAHESNSLPGMATKMLTRYVDRVFVSSSDTLKHLPPIQANRNVKYVITGNPLRKEFRKIDYKDKGSNENQSRTDALTKLNLKEGMTILSFGGSLGANKITEAVVELLKWEREQNNQSNQCKPINHIHAYGGNGKAIFEKLLLQNGLSAVNGRNIFSEYIHNMYTCITAADLVICRSGSMSQTEIKAFGRASIQIPWSGAAENHQYYNALTMKNAGAAILITDDEISGAKLIETVSRLYNDRLRIRLMEEKAKEMSEPNAAGVIVSEIIDLLK
ncbi:MAG: UDP-N-acetylglucosamine--N-acetylmuramyl-(pentapeptide) pyrophosphoryl-undecaprenol N-acetylglucosamine transferase [Oscillospiraceae bacterium]|nr:UDP-N-acetylglucosamine--N-acetylmuramyl-(pentapeptide) pyrophosphoryl-undecaprenol N-acetylglucosamine transferase [Oscillospiraceae bacterium]